MKTSAALIPASEGVDQTPLDLIHGELEFVREATDDSDATTVQRAGPKTVMDATPNVVELPTFRELKHRPTEFFAAVQEWEGAVTGVFDDHFTADLYDVAGTKAELTEIADISFEDIDPADRSRVREGAIFRWLIGHSRTRSGSFSRKWVIYFRRAVSNWHETAAVEKIQIPANLKPQLN